MNKKNVMTNLVDHMILFSESDKRHIYLGMLALSPELTSYWLL